MAKRKREDAEEEPSVKQRRIQYKLKLAVTKIGHAFKVAKGFERQKLGRRRKNAASQSNEKDVARIDSEIEALKAIDTAASAQHHFYKTLIKSKAASNHPDVPAKVKQPVKSSTDAATLNVNARLCKSNPVKDALSVAIVDIQQALGLEIDLSGLSKKPRTRAKDFDADASVPPEDVDGAVIQPSARRASSEDGDESLDSQSAEDISIPNDRVASTSDNSECDDRDIAALERELELEGLKRKSATRQPKYGPEKDLSISDSENERQSASPEPMKTTTSKKAMAFLSSLTMGGYISGSGSDLEDDIDEAPRKNRRGQRARQQIWEKKYGAKAKHLQGQGQGQDRNQGWDPKRGAVEGGRRNDRGHQRERRASPDYAVGGDRLQPKRRAAGDRNQVKHKDDSGPIHPSWEAAKKAKEKKAAPVAFQGKKITFA